jgi:hypothetical protein
MDGMMNPIEHKGPKDYFWFAKPTFMQGYGGFLVPGIGHYMWEFHPTLPIRAALGDLSKSTLRVERNEILIAEFDLSKFPEDRWEDLGDGHGKKIPLRVIVHEGDVAGQWLPDPGIPPPPPATLSCSSLHGGSVSSLRHAVESRLLEIELIERVPSACQHANSRCGDVARRLFPVRQRTGWGFYG